MIVRLIDISGGMTAEMLEQVRREIKVGDRVIFFDTQPHGDRIIQSQEEIDNLKFRHGGGTMLASTLELVERTAPDAIIYCYTDGFFYDGREYDSATIQNSSFYKARRFKLVIL